MPIQVSCLACGAKLSVMEKFAGKEGPCPKCGATINIPAVGAAAAPAAPTASRTARKPAAPAKTGSTGPRIGSPTSSAPAPAAAAPAVPDVVVHAPEEFSSGGKTISGKALTKPLTREDATFNLLYAAGGVAGAVAALALAWLLGQVLAGSGAMHVGLILLYIGLCAVPLAWGGYWILSDPEMERFSGKALWARVSICALLYMLLWFGVEAVRVFVPDPYAEFGLHWILPAVAALVLGIGAAFVCFDLEVENSALHFALFLIASIILRGVGGLTWV